MSMSVSGSLKTLRNSLLLLAAVFVWLVFFMIYTDHFARPFIGIRHSLMPWRAPATNPPQASIDQRITMMQRQLDSANRTSHYALLSMIGSFSFICIYFTLVYQQKQRRARENRLLTLKNHEIARRNEFIRYISATIGHEFKNNLGRIKRRIDLLEDLSPDARARIDENLHKMFADIDIFKKISDERETGLVDFAKVDIKAMLEKMAGQFSDLADFSFVDEMHPPAIFASQTLLKTVFENLTDNAIKYKKSDQPHARIFIECSLDVDGLRQYLSISFRDEGIGMNEQDADGCFYKANESRSGWGQGLYFAKYVVGLHAGKIRVGKEYTAPGRGAEIIINLPFVEEAINV